MAVYRYAQPPNLPAASARRSDRALRSCSSLSGRKALEGCGGLELTDEIRVTIAAQACLLLLHRDTDYYPQLITILVYPSSFTAYEARHLGGNIWEEGGQERLGHTARRLGAMVLAWDSAKRGAADPSDGRNLVLHEFAHQLDFEDFRPMARPLSRREQSTWPGRES